MVTGNDTFVKLLPIAPVRVLSTGNFDYGVNLAGSDYLSRLLIMSFAIFTNT